jgi:putative peptide zinc metalloprotease protein
MPTLQDSLVSSAARWVPMRMRPDLVASLHRYHGRVYWVVKEPVGLHYFRFQEEEFAILKMLDGQSSLDDMQERFEKEFPPQKITVEELANFIGMLHGSGLVVSDAPGQGTQLKERRDKRKRQELLSTLANILAIRFKGIDPDRLLSWMFPFMRWMYSPPAVTVCATLALSALLLVAVQFDEFQSKLPTFHQFFTASNWIYLGAVLGVTKVIHEFGHGLTCKRFGGECHEMGVMLLVCTPCLYCNVSDSWLLPNKWHRIAIGAGGMYIELVMASIATFIWWFTEPGMLNQICLSTMFVCSVSTVMFNANPLLRYDGYYILADLLEIPNLRQKASQILNRKLSHWCLGLEEPPDPFLPQRHQVLFAVYSVASAIYRWVVTLSIFWFLYEVLAPYGLKVISQMIATASIVSLVAQPAWKVGKFFYIPGRLDQVKRKNVQITLGVFATVALFVFAMPLPHRVFCALEIKPRNAKSVYVEVPGQLKEVLVKPGQYVRRGTVLARLTSLDLELGVADLVGRHAEYVAKEKHLRHSKSDNEQAASQLPQMREMLKMLEDQLVERRADLARLELIAPIDGTILPPRENTDHSESSGQLKGWTGTPFEPRNLGATLPESTLFCEIGDPHQMEAELIIEQDDLESVHKGQAVAIKLDELPHRTFRSEIVEIDLVDLKVMPHSLSSKAGGEAVTKTDEASGTEKPFTTSYFALAPIDDPEGVLTNGLKGRAKISTRWQTLGRQARRYLSRTFNFRL